MAVLCWLVVSLSLWIVISKSGVQLAIFAIISAVCTSFQMLALNCCSSKVVLAIFCFLMSEMD